jgi:hypothetical protein
MCEYPKRPIQARHDSEVRRCTKNHIVRYTSETEFGYSNDTANCLVNQKRMMRTEWLAVASRRLLQKRELASPFTLADSGLALVRIKPTPLPSFFVLSFYSESRGLPKHQYKMSMSSSSRKAVLILAWTAPASRKIRGLFVCVGRGNRP